MRSATAATRNDPQAAARTRWLSRIICWIFLVVPASAALAQATDDRIDVQAERRGGLIHVQARALLRAPMTVVWRTLTDYEGLPAFIPGLSSSRVVARNGAVVTVEQTGQARFLFLTVPIAVTLESTERPPDVVEVRRVKGSIQHLEGRYEATPQANGKVLLRWTGALSPDAELPPLIETALVRLSIQDQFVGMVHEIERRAGSREPTTEPRASNR
jgi:ribosome-associated toxin RatA of RatAB toxin-antitoxin module